MMREDRPRTPPPSAIMFQLRPSSKYEAPGMRSSFYEEHNDRNPDCGEYSIPNERSLSDKGWP